MVIIMEYFIRQKGGNTYTFFKYRKFRIVGLSAEKIPVLMLETQSAYRQRYKEVIVYLRTIEETNLPELTDAIKTAQTTLSL